MGHFEVHASDFTNNPPYVELSSLGRDRTLLRISYEDNAYHQNGIELFLNTEALKSLIGHLERALIQYKHMDPEDYRNEIAKVKVSPDGKLDVSEKKETEE